MDGNVFLYDYVEISPEEALECAEAFNQYGATGCLEYLKSKSEEWQKIPVNLAVIGSSGTGKSTFINTMRDLKSNNPGAARVGVNETTKEIKAYPHPNNENVIFWDLPGVGTEKFPKESYLETIKFEKYDCYVIMTAARFYENDAWLGEEIKKRKKGFYYIRSKIDLDVQNDEKENGKCHDVPKLIDDIRKATIDEVYKKLEFEPPLFLVDSYNKKKYDFEEVERRIIEDLPKQKRNAVVLSLSAFSKSMIRTKVCELRSRAWYMAILSGGVAAVPFPGLSVIVDAGIMLTEAMFYYKQLGLDEASLKVRADLFSTDYERLEEIVLKHIPEPISLNYIKSIAVGGIHITGAVVEEFMRYVPFVGSLIAAPLSLAVTRYTLGCILDKMEEVALEIADFTEHLTS